MVFRFLVFGLIVMRHDIALNKTSLVECLECLGERLSVSICGGLATGRASWGRICRLARARQFWWEQESCRNLEESVGIRWKYRNSCPAGIPAKNPVKVAENRNFQDPSKTTFL